MKKIGVVVLAVLTLILAAGLATSAAAPAPSEETCFKVDVTDAFKGASGDVSGKCPGATVTSVCVKAATETFCASNSCFTIDYSGSSWSVSENWPDDDKGSECHDISWYKVCYECPPPVCEEVDTHYGKWSDWSDWSECINGEQQRTRTREVWTTDKNDPSIECNRWTEKETQTQWCDLCKEVDTHYGEWGPWSDWSDCVDGEKTRTRTREVWTTDKNHPEVECDRWTEKQTQTMPCEFCEEVDTHYGKWSDWSDWSECINGEQQRTRTREVWTTDKNDPSIECNRWTEKETQTRDCEEPTPTPTPTPPPEPAGCNLPPTEAGCKKGFVPYALPNGKIVCRNSDCLEEPSCICPPPACYPRLNIWIYGCLPPELNIVGYSNFDEDSHDRPTEKRPYVNKPWEKNPFIVDLNRGIKYRFWGWDPKGGDVYLFDVGPIKQCPTVIDKDHTFPCPVPTPMPTPEPEELPVTGFGPPPTANNLPDPFAVIGLALIVLGGLLKKMAQR